MLIKMKESKGFTLVELMIVVAIIGILAAVAVPYYQRYVAKSRLTSLVMPAVHSIETNMGTYYAVQTRLPCFASCPSGQTQSAIEQFTGDADTHYLDIDTSTWNSTSESAQLKVSVKIDAADAAGKRPFSAIGSGTDGRNVFYLVAQQAPTGQKLYWSFAGTLATELGL